MTEEFIVTDVNINDIVGDAEHYSDGEHLAENLGPEIPTDIDCVIANTDDVIVEKKTASTAKPEVVRSTKLPIARVKHIMKMDPDVNVLTGDAVFLVTKATEMFLETIVKETYAHTSSNKRKVISKKDLDNVINTVDCLCFLEGAMDF